jgi:MazG family protein
MIATRALLARRMPSRRARPRVRRPDGAATRARRAGNAISRLARVMHVLRSPVGCPWDREQTHASLRTHLIEETYEAVEAIDRADLPALEGELGDVLMQVVFHAQIAAESKRFDLAAVIDGITRKLVRRHPHVFTPAGRTLSAGRRRAANIQTPTAVKAQWEQIKAREPGRRTGRPGVLTGLPRSLPALQRAHEIGRRVAAVGFDWTRADDVVAKIEEETRELRAALAEPPERRSEELGDLLFALANLARKLGIDAESALRQANDKFSRRFEAMEAHFDRRGNRMDQAGLDELERVWTQVKALEHPAVPAGPSRRGRRTRAPRG